MFHTPKTNNNESEGVLLACPSPPRPNPTFANLPSYAGMPVPCSSSDQQLSSALQRRPAPLLSLSSHQSSASSTSTCSSLAASDRPSLTATTDYESFASSSIGDEQEFFLTAPGVIRPANRYDRMAVNNNNIVNIVPQDHYPVIRLQPRRSSS